MSFTEAMEFQGSAIELPCSDEFNVGDFIVFEHNAIGFPDYGRVHSIDLVAEYPFTFEWYTWHDVKRKSRFKPDEITALKVKENLDDARAEATARRRAYAEQTPRG